MKRIIYACILATICHLAIQAADTPPKVRPVRAPVAVDLGLSVPKPTQTIPEGRADKIVVYTATWCAPCQAFKPTLARLKRAGAKVEVHDIDDDGFKPEYTQVKRAQADQLTEWWSVPTIFYLRDGVVIKRDDGMKSYRHIMKTLWKP